MAQETALQVIELQQLPIIVERLHSVKADIEQRTADALSLVCTEQTYKSVKDARAQLTKEFKEYEAQRIAVKDKILEPYAEFEKVYRECVTVPFQTADAELKRKITDVTSGIVSQKTDAVQEYYNELVEAAGIDWMDDLTYRPKVNMSDSVTALKNKQRRLWTVLCPMWLQSKPRKTLRKLWWSTGRTSICPQLLKPWMTGTRRWKNSADGKKNAVPGKRSVKPPQKRFAPLLRLRPRNSPNRRRKSPQTRKWPCSLNRCRNPSRNPSL